MEDIYFSFLQGPRLSASLLFHISCFLSLPAISHLLLLSLRAFSHLLLIVPPCYFTSLAFAPPCYCTSLAFVPPCYFTTLAFCPSVLFHISCFYPSVLFHISCFCPSVLDRLILSEHPSEFPDNPDVSKHSLRMKKKTPRENKSKPGHRG